jgi:ABC-type lipoprotein release transport system permease subunit
VYKLFLAVRYLRSRKISLLSVLGVMFGVTTLLAVTSIMGGFARDLRARIRGMTAHVTISQSRSAYKFVEGWEELDAKVRAVPGVTATAPQVEWPIMISKGPKPAAIVGIDPEREKVVSGFASHVLDGHPPDFSFHLPVPDGMMPCIIGSNVLGVHKNKDLVFIAAGAGANAATAATIEVTNPKDGLNVMTGSDEWSDELERGEDEGEAAAWIRGRADEEAGDWVALVRRALDLLAYDPKGEVFRIAAVVIVSPVAPSKDDIRNAWMGLSPEQRAMLSVVSDGQVLREPGKDSFRDAQVICYRPADDIKLRLSRPWVDGGLGDPLVSRFFGITTISPSDVANLDVTERIRPTDGKLLCVGAFNSGMSEYDNQIIYAPLHSVQEMLREPGKINKLRVSVRDYNKAREVAQAIRAAIGPGYTVITWEEEKAILLQAVAVERTLNGIILFFIVLVAAFSILATLTMLVTEKTRDIGIIRALGANVGGVMSIFLTEGLIIGGVGCGAGCGLAAIILKNLNPLADWIYDKTGWYPFPKDIYLLDRIPHEVNPPAWFLIVGATLFVCTLAALAPAWKAARLNPVEALRYE